MMFSGDEDFGDDITSGVDKPANEPDDFEEYNRNEAEDYCDE